MTNILTLFEVLITRLQNIEQIEFLTTENDESKANKKWIGELRTEFDKMTKS